MLADGCIRGKLSAVLITEFKDHLHLCGDIVAIQAAESNTARDFPVEDTAAMTLRFASGALGTLTISDSANAPWSGNSRQARTRRTRRPGT